MKRGKVLIVLNKAWNLYNFRAGLIRALVDADYDVVAAAPADEYVDRVKALGCRFVALPQSNHGTSIISDLGLIWRFWRLLRQERPDTYLGFTVKPNTYGSMVAGWMGVRVINNIAGLGTAFLRGGWLGWLVRHLYRLGLARSHRVFFQNSADRDVFLAHGLVQSAQVQLVPGSGVDVRRFSPPDSDSGGPGHPATVFLLVARLLRDKGVVEFVEAARQVRAHFPQTRFQLLGYVDEANPNGVRCHELEAWVREGLVEYLGTTDDVRPYLSAASCVVLPSYREGTSRALLEAAAMARPIIATDVPGCREVVDEGRSGYLCRARDVPALQACMERFCGLDDGQRRSMGDAGRSKVLREYDETLVIAAYLGVLP